MQFEYWIDTSYMFCGSYIHHLILVHMCISFSLDFVGFGNLAELGMFQTMHLGNVILLIFTCMRSFGSSKYDCLVVNYIFNGDMRETVETGCSSVIMQFEYQTPRSMFRSVAMCK